MKELFALVKRNCKLFFRDKGMFFTSLITPVILLVLYSTFLAKVYRNSFVSALPEGVTVSDALINGTVGGQLVSSLLAVSCVTVAFCSNLLTVQDRVSGARNDLDMTPVKSGTLALGYFVSSAVSTLIICFVAAAAGLGYIAATGWYMSAGDVLFLLLDVFLLSLFGTALSSVVNCGLKTNGQASAVGTVVSSGYGFICGAYMPISQFGDGLQKVLSFLPGTYGTSLLRNHALNGVFGEMSEAGFPDEVIDGIKDSVDCNLYFFDDKVATGTMYIILAASVTVLIGIYIMINVLRKGNR